jgi:catechol 2,3-dioxygenase-like lactoylglutathione lyase family enzyme
MVNGPLRLSCNHLELPITSLAETRRFYCDLLGLRVLQEMPEIGFIAFLAGEVRLSCFVCEEASPADGGVHFALRTDDLDALIAALTARGFSFEGSAYEAPGFGRFIAARDPTGHRIEFGQYYRDPLEPA